MSVNGTFVEEEKCVDSRVNMHIVLYSFNKCPIYGHDGASAKFSTNSHETYDKWGGGGQLMHEVKNYRTVF
jgi:hypothetical protein